MEIPVQFALKTFLEKGPKKHCHKIGSFTHHCEVRTGELHTACLSQPDLSKSYSNCLY